jgi:hypothetical protein
LLDSLQLLVCNWAARLHVAAAAAAVLARLVGAGGGGGGVCSCHS